MRDWLKYVEQLEAHMDEGGKIGPNNVRDLIQAVRELSDQSPIKRKKARPGREARASKLDRTSKRTEGPPLSRHRELI